MLKRIGIIMVILLFAAGHHAAKGQDFVATPVELSSEKVSIQGSIHFVHKVLKGQTIFSISKAYNVSTDELLQANPSLKDGLKAGTLIFIPIHVHKPEVVESAPVIPEPQKDKKYKKYTVKWYENIYDVAQRFSVPIDALLAINKLNEESVLEKRQVLMIPDKEYITEYNRAKKGSLVSTPKKDLEISFPADTLQEPQADTVKYIPTPIQDIARTYKVTLLLPFDGNNQMDLYAGALLAFRDFKKETGDRLYTLNVIDLNEYGTISSVIRSGVLDDSEFIIGPIFEKNLSELSQWSMEKGIPLISPLDPKAGYIAKSSPYFFQFPPAQEQLIQATYNGVANEAHAHGSKPIIIYEKWTRHSQLVTQAMNAIRSRCSQTDTLGYGILEGRGVDTVMVSKMDTLRVNTLFVVSESEAFVSDVLRNLQLAKGQNSKLEISLWGLPKWKNFEIIELSYFHNLNTHMALQYYIDYTDPRTLAFVDEFRYNFRTEPTQYAFQGYDVMNYFINALHEYGRSFPAYLHMHEKSLLQSDVRFEKADNYSGYTNTGVRDIIYSGNWSIKPWE
jgi:LysM repeat protein